MTSLLHFALYDCHRDDDIGHPTTISTIVADRNDIMEGDRRDDQTDGKAKREATTVSSGLKRWSPGKCA